MQLYRQAITQYNSATPVQKSYLSVVLTLGLLILLILLVFPAVNHILKLNNEIAKGRDVNNKLQEKIIALEEAEANYENLKGRLKIADDALPTGSAVDKYLRQIENAAKRNKTTLASIQFADVPVSLPKNKGNLSVRQVDYTITVEGNFSNIQKFVEEMEKLIRTTNFTQISINEDGSKLAASLQATVYYLGDTVATTPIEGSKN